MKRSIVAVAVAWTACMGWAETWDFTQGVPEDGSLRKCARVIEGEGLSTTVFDDGQFDRYNDYSGFQLNEIYDYPAAFRFECQFVVQITTNLSWNAYLWDDMAAPGSVTRGLMVQICRYERDMYPRIYLGLGDRTVLVTGPDKLVHDGDVLDLAFTYDANRHLRIEFAGQTADYEVPVAAPIAKPTWRKAVLGDRCATESNLCPLEGVLKNVSITALDRGPCSIVPEGRLAFVRGEAAHRKTIKIGDKSARAGARVPVAGGGRQARGRGDPPHGITFKIGNTSAGALSGVRATFRQLDTEDNVIAQSSASLGNLAAGEERDAIAAVKTRVRPGEGRMEVTVSGVNGSASFSMTDRFVLSIGKTFAERMPTLMWGYQGEDDLVTNLGFTHATATFGFDAPQKDADNLSETFRKLDEAVSAGLRKAKIFDVMYPSDYEDGRYYRTHRDGSTDGKAKPAPEVSQPALQAYARQVAADNARVFGGHPAFAGALATSELRMNSFPSFNTEADRYKTETGRDVPDEAIGDGVDKTVAPKRYPNGVVPEADDLYAYYRWFWKGGDGWPGYSGAIADGLRDGGLGPQPFFSFFDPAVRCPAVWGSGGSVDSLNQWCYANPEPLNVAGPAEEMFAMAEGRPGQDVKMMTQIICYRSQLAPTNYVPQTAPAWLENLPDAEFVGIPPDLLQEAMWAMLAKPVTGIMHHGWGCLYDCGRQGKYSYTNPETPARLRELLTGLVAPLGPALLKIGREPQKVAILESGTTQMLDGSRGSSFGYTAPSITFFQRARLDPRVVYEETILSNGLDGVKVLFAPNFKFTTQAVLDRIAAFRQNGGILVGDKNTLAALKDDLDVEVQVAAFSTAAPKGDTAEEINAQVYAEGVNVDRRAATLNSKVTMNQQAEEIRAALAEKGYVPAADSSSPEIVVFNRRWGETPYLFAINDKRDFGDYVGQWGCVMEDGKPFEGSVSVPDADEEIAAVYELSRGGEAEFTRAEDGRVTVPLSFETNDGRLLMFLKEKIGSVSVAATPARIWPGEDIDIEVRVCGESGEPVPAVLPVDVRVYDAAGRELDGAGYAAAEGGVCRLKVPTNLNDAEGAYRIVATDRASGRSAETSVTVKTAERIGNATIYEWDGTSTAYGDLVSVVYDENGQVTKLTSSVPRDEKVVFVGGSAEFASDAVISLASVGSLVFSNRVVTAGGVTVESEIVDTVIGGEDRGFIRGVSKVLPITFADFDELSIPSATISYMSGSTQVNLDCVLYHETREPDRYSVQVQDYNGAWTRGIKIEMTPCDEGVVVKNVYARQSSDYGVNHEGEDFDAPTFKYSDSASLFLTKVKISVDCSPALRQVHFVGKLEAGGAVTVSKGANVFATGTALGAVDDATCDLGVNFDKGTFTFLDCGYFTYAGTVTGNTGSLIFGSSDAEPQASQEVFLDNLTKTDQTVAYGASLASLTGVTAVVRWNRYNDATLEDVMKDEFRGDLPAAFFRNLGDETVVRFQAMSKTWGSLMNSAAVRFRQDGTNIVARTVATYDQWTSGTKAQDPWLWDAANDGARIRDPETYLRALSNVVLRLDCPKGDVNWDTRMMLACADSSTGVSYVFKPGANRRLTTIVTSDTGMPQVQGEVHVYDRAIVTLAGRDFSKDGYTPTYQGHWQGQTGSNAAKIFVHEGGKMLTNQRAQNSGYGQVISLDNAVYAFRDAVSGNENTDYKFLRGNFISGCIGGVAYKDGAVTDGYGPYLGTMGASTRMTVTGTKPSFCRNNFYLYSNGSGAQNCTLAIDDVTGDESVDFTMEGAFIKQNYNYARLVKTGAGTVLLMKKNDTPIHKILIQDGTVLMGMKDGLGTKGVSLEGGTLAIQAGLTNSISGPLALTADSAIKLAVGSKILIDDSSSETWADGALLTITGDPATSAISFGDADGLTAAQLRQIRWNGKRVEFDEDGCLKQYIPGAAIIVR